MPTGTEFQLRHANVVAAISFEDGEQMRDAEEVSNWLAHVDELKFTIRFASGNVETDKRAETGAVHSSESSEIEDNAFFVRELFLDMRFEKRGALCDECSRAVQDEDVLVLLRADG
jgi:hypothetical protein